MNDQFQSSLDDPQAQQQGNGARTYEDGCTICGQVGTIAAGSIEEGYECSDCWESNGWSSDRQEQITSGSIQGKPI